MPQATTKTIEVTYLPITSPTDMADALVAALSIGYSGGITAIRDNNGAVAWSMEVTGPGNPTAAKARIGDVYVWDGHYVTVMQADEFADKYTPA